MKRIRTLAVIPARYQSSRFPGKPLQDIAGKSLLQRVWERVRLVRSIDEVVVATDDERIQAAAEKFGAAVAMTLATHPSGSDRVAEVVEQYQERGEKFDCVVNVQGDMPFINPEIVAQLIAEFSVAGADIAIGTVATPIISEDEFLRPTAVKVVLAGDKTALYFSRAPIPHVRDKSPGPQAARNYGLRHIGLYIFRPESLSKVTRLPEGILEGKEKLEQLRALENNMPILVTVVEREMLEPNIEVDTPEDFQKAVAYCRQNKI